MADNPTDGTRTALITGAGRRIGAAIALALVRAGYSVVLHANNSREDAEALTASIAGAGGKASVVLADLADHEAVRGLVPAAAAFGRLALLVNNAGEFEPDDIETLSTARFRRAIAVNLEAPLFLSQAFAAQVPDAKLALVHGRRRTRHEIDRLRRLRERHHFANRRLAGEDGADAIETERDAAVRRRAELERVEEEAESGFRVLV